MVHENSRRRPRRALRTFRVTWTTPPTDDVIIAAGASALRLYLSEERQREAQGTLPPANPE
jgi:hypothetical protein